MTNKILIPRELAQRLVNSMDAHCYGFDGDDELRDLLARPVVESSSPLFYVGQIDGYGCLLTEESSGSIKLYASPTAAVALVLPTHQEMHTLICKAARQADLTSGSNYHTAAEFAAIAFLDKLKELNQ
ncbi:MAG: hypothetical protein KKC24_23720 [Gammaproteobacteria bacterium]|nr:hypothetical protein [Gammaproteobacteria bacterium]MBU0821857.1 hypothetical protein [Gammaproteobacteria bacterium]MBU0843970.1 hypothetical protein [Gammaproteobacteria bacterium]MBU1842221.1 hypothetical protein [Gammaproteobacteria bacterium]